MSPRSSSRWLAPLALLAALAAVLFVISSATGGGDDGDDGDPPAATSGERASTGEEGETETSARTSTTPRRKSYTVKPGDTLASISEQTGVSVETLLELNDDIDPNSLTVGDKIRLE